MRQRGSWMAEVILNDPMLRGLQRRFDQRLRQWELRRAVGELRRLGEPGAVGRVAARFGVSRWVVQRALRETRR